MPLGRRWLMVILILLLLGSQVVDTVLRSRAFDRWIETFSMVDAMFVIALALGVWKHAQERPR
jgi:hypothetical protein